MGRYAISHSVQTIERSDIVTAAARTADYIADLVADKRVDPDNLIVMLGENHHEITHQYFQLSLMQKLHQTTGIARLFVEDWKQDQARYDREAKRNSYYKTLHGMLVDKSTHAKSYALSTHFAYQKNIPVHAVDMHYYYSLEEKALYTRRVLPQSFRTKYSDHKKIAALCRKHPDLFEAGEPCKLISEEGLLRRNLFMMDNMLDCCAQQKGVSVGTNGSLHLLDYYWPKRTTLSDLLYANKKDIVNVVLLVTEKDEVAMYDRACREQGKRIARTRSKNFFENIGIEIKSAPQKGLEGLLGLYQENDQAAPLNLRAIHAVRKILYR